MEIILKKTKITNSILKQTLRSTEIDLKLGEILGWCVFNGIKFIVCYRSDVHGLSIFPMFYELIPEQRFKGINGFDNFAVNVKIGNGFKPLVFVFSTHKENEDFISLLNKIKFKSQSKGQFFI